MKRCPKCETLMVRKWWNLWMWSCPNNQCTYSHTNSTGAGSHPGRVERERERERPWPEPSEKKEVVDLGNWEVVEIPEWNRAAAEKILEQNAKILEMNGSLLRYLQMNPIMVSTTELKGA